ncbi:hypothetical protein STENM223S_00801 [Streptomyces tendae]
MTGALGKVLGGRAAAGRADVRGGDGPMFGGFRTRADASIKLLAPGTAFLVVAAPERDALREAAYFVERLAAEDMPLAGLVLNRVHGSRAGCRRAGAGGGGLHRHRLLARPHGGRPQGHLAVHAEGDRRHRGLALLRARGDRPQGRPARVKNKNARSGDRGRLHAHPAVREERLRRGGRRRPDEGRAGHPADHRPQDPGAEVRDPGELGEEDPRELPEHHVLRPAGLRRRGRVQRYFSRARQGPQPPGVGPPRRRIVHRRAATTR